jgi:hypothetical protein
MSLEANKFLSRIYGEAVSDQNRQDEIIKKIKVLNESKSQLITGDLSLDVIDYNFFRRILNNVSSDIFAIQNDFVEDNDDTIVEDVSKLIRNWNFTVTALSKIKYNNLKYVDHLKIYNDIKEIQPSLIQISNLLIAKAATDSKFEGLKTRIDNIISQINSDIYDQVSYPLKEQVDQLVVP